jgi:3-phenylpropionate/trans-cinnamate dioxygenase ferredoxin subunit
MANSPKLARNMSSIKYSDLQDSKPIKVNVDGEDICVTRIGDEVFAIGDNCTHSDASLSEGDVTNFKIECWLHGAEFDLRTGEALTLPANIPAKTYPVTVIDGIVQISVNTK